MGVRYDEVLLAREHNEKQNRDKLDDARKNQRCNERHFPSGEQIAPAVYVSGDMVIVGDKY